MGKFIRMPINEDQVDQFESVGITVERSFVALVPVVTAEPPETIPPPKPPPRERTNGASRSGQINHGHHQWIAIGDQREIDRHKTHTKTGAFLTLCLKVLTDHDGPSMSRKELQAEVVRLSVEGGVAVPSSPSGVISRLCESGALARVSPEAR